MLTSKAAFLFALYACSSSTPSTPSANRASASKERAPELIRKAGDSTFISRRLLSLPESLRRDALRATPGRETIELPFKGTDAPARVVLYRAVAPAHGIVFYGGRTSDENRELVIGLLASRGYHVVSSDMLELYVVNADLAAWATMTLGQLPIACVDVHRCQLDRDPRVGSAAPAGAPKSAAAIVDDEIWPADLCHVGCAGPVPELVLVGREPRGPLSTHDNLRATCADKRERARAVVTGVTFRGKRDLEPVGQFAVIEAFLAQHLGGRAEPLDIAELRSAGLRVTYGLDQVAALAAHRDLELVQLDAAARAKLDSGFAELLTSVRGAVTTGCPGLVERLQRLPVPDILVRYCESDELRVLASRFHDEALGVIADAGCDDALDAAAPSEMLISQCDR